ncbi:MAG: MarC family protein [Chthonomonadales bacterium]|nr:MarC family protein [Chthonomonadales bacterium]
MDETLPRYAATAFVTLIVVVDPLGMVPIFAAVAAGQERPARMATLRRAIAIALGLALLFMAAGRAMLAYLGVTVHAFAISGGILLFASALPMLFGQRGGLQAPELRERDAAGLDVAIFPLAVPLLSGPGVLTSVLLLTSQAGGAVARLLLLAACLVVVFLVAWLVLWLGDRALAWVGQAGVHLATRVMGIILAALAVQYVLNGVSGYYHSLAGA